MRVPSTPVLAVACALLAAMVLSPTVFGEWVWDDHQLIALNPHVSGFDLHHLVTHHFWDVPMAPPTFTLYYRPVAGVGHAVTWLVGGGDVLYFHLLNLLLHAACTALTIVWLVRRIPDGGGTLGRTAVTLATLAFALHPARVQSVAWASASTDLWATFFVLLGINLVATKRTAPLLAGAGVSFALGILSKEVAVVGPVLLLLDDHLVRGRKPKLRTAGFVLLPAVGALALRTAIVGFQTGAASRTAVDIPKRAAFTVGRYVVDAFLPVSPTVQLNAPFDRIWNAEPHGVATTVLGAAVILSVVAGAVLLYRRPKARPWLGDLAWLALPLLPVLNIVQIGQGVTVASRLLYLPLLGLTAMFARVLARLFRGRFRVAGLGVAGGVIIAFAVLSTEEIAHWQDDVVLARHLREQRPHDAGVADNLARVLLRHGNLEEAYGILSERIDTHGDAQLGAYAQVTWAYTRLALTSDHDQGQLLELRRLFDGIASGTVPSIELPERRLAPRLEDADRVEIMNNPTYGDFYDAWGWAHARTGDPSGARRIFDEAPAITRESAHGCNRRVRARAFEADWDAALSLLTECEERHRDPAWPAIRQALERGRALWSRSTGDPIDDAVARSRLMSDLGLPALGRAILSPFETVADTRLVHARVQAHISDERYDLALAELDAAIEAMPSARDELRGARAEVARFAAASSGRRSPPIWER